MKKLINNSIKLLKDDIEIIVKKVILEMQAEELGNKMAELRDKKERDCRDIEVYEDYGMLSIEDTKLRIQQLKDKEKKYDTEISELYNQFIKIKGSLR